MLEELSNLANKGDGLLRNITKGFECHDATRFYDVYLCNHADYFANHRYIFKSLPQGRKIASKKQPPKLPQVTGC